MEMHAWMKVKWRSLAKIPEARRIKVQLTSVRLPRGIPSPSAPRRPHRPVWHAIRVSAHVVLFVSTQLLTHQRGALIGA
jgi:hypothetical protein